MNIYINMHMNIMLINVHINQYSGISRQINQKRM